MPAVPRLVIAPLMSLVLAGCAVGPDYVQPALQMPARFHNAAKLEQRQSASQADLVRWWDGFNDPILSRLVAQSLTDNLDLEQAIARVSQARALLGASRAALLPAGQISADANRFYQSRQSLEGRMRNAISPDFDRAGSLYNTNLAAAWELDFFGGRRRDHEAALALLQASEAGAVAARLSVAAQTADTYLLIRGLQERLAIARAQTAAQQRLLETVKLQYDAGVVAELPLRQAESLLSQVQASVPMLEVALESALNALEVGLGAQPGTHHAELSQASVLPAAPTLVDAGGPAELLRRRPDLIAAERRLAASNAGIGSAISEYYPKVSLKGLIGTVTTSFGGVLSGGAEQAQATVGLRWRLFDFARIEAEIAASRGRHREALAAYKLAVLRASEDVENTITAVLGREEQARLLANGEHALVRAHEAATAAYEGGTVSLVEVLDADIRLLATRDARAVARMEAARAVAASFKALGGGWDAATNVESDAAKLETAVPLVAQGAAD